ncbi:MAG TPA: hypothetical protein DDW27_20160 [Bacteroidales bacterium]|nr:hypothetical protein [Bacteroidales bacterium]
MNLFIDANIIVAVLNKEYPLFSLAARIMSLQDDKRFSIYTSPLCLAIAFYFAEIEVFNCLHFFETYLSKK